MTESNQYIVLLIQGLYSVTDSPLSEIIWRSKRILGKENDDEEYLSVELLINSLKEIENFEIEGQGKCRICPRFSDEGFTCSENHFICQDCLHQWFHFNLDRENLEILCPGQTNGNLCCQPYNPSSLSTHLHPNLLDTWQNLNVSIAFRGEEIIKCSFCGYMELSNAHLLDTQLGGVWTCSNPECMAAYCYKCDPPIFLGKNNNKKNRRSLYNMLKHGHRIPLERHRQNIERIISLDEPILCPQCKIIVDTPHCNILVDHPVQTENLNNMFRCSQCYFWYCFLCSKKLHRDEKKSLSLFESNRHHNPTQKCECQWNDKAKLHWKKLKVIEYVDKGGFDLNEVKSVLMDFDIEFVEDNNSSICRIM